MIYDIVHTEKSYVQCLERLDGESFHVFFFLISQVFYSLEFDFCCFNPLKTPDHLVQPYLVQYATTTNENNEALKKTSSFFSTRNSRTSSQTGAGRSASVMVCLQTVTQLKTLHREFLSTLQQRVTTLRSETVDGEEKDEDKNVTDAATFHYDDPSVLIGDLFERFGSLFRLYTQYQNNYDALMDSCRTTDSLLSNVVSAFRMELFSQGSPLKGIGTCFSLSFIVFHCFSCSKLHFLIVVLFWCSFLFLF